MPAADSSDSPDAEVSIRKQEKANIPLFSGVHLPDILSKVMDNSVEHSPDLPAAEARRIMETPAKGEMTVLAQRLGKINLENTAIKADNKSRSSTPSVKPSKLDFEEEEKENIPDSSEKRPVSAGKPPVHTPPRNPFLDASPSNTPARNGFINGSPKDTDGNTTSPANSNAASPNTQDKINNDALEYEMSIIKDAVFDANNADSIGNRTLCESFKNIETQLKTNEMTPSFSECVRNEMPALIEVLEKSLKPKLPKLNDRALHLINMLVESGCTKDSDFINRLFDFVADLSTSVHLASGTLALFLNQEPGQASRIPKVKNMISIVRHLEKQATSLRQKNSQRRIKMVEAAIEIVREIMNPGYLRQKNQNVPPLGILTRQSSFATTPLSTPPFTTPRPFSSPFSSSRPHSSPRVYQLPTNFSNLVGASPSFRSPQSAGSPVFLGTGSPPHQLSSGLQSAGSPKGRIFSQAELDAAIRAAVMETENRHREISSGAQQNIVRNAVAEAEIKQKEALQAEYNTAVTNRVQEAVDKLRETLEAEHAHALLKAVAEVEEKYKNENRVDFEKAVKKKVEEENEKMTAAHREKLDSAVGKATQETEKMLNARLELIEFELENVTVGAERSVAEISGRLEEAKKDLEIQRMAHSEQIAVLEKRSIDDLRIAKETSQKQKELIDSLKAEIEAMVEKNEEVVDQNKQLRKATLELQKVNQVLKDKSEKKLSNAFVKAKENHEALVQREAELNQTKHMLGKTKEKLAEEEDKVAELMTKLSTSELRVNRVENESTRLLEKNKDQMSKVQKLEKECTALRERCEELTVEYESMQKQMRRMKIDKAEFESNKNKVKELNKELGVQRERAFTNYSNYMEKEKEANEIYEVTNKLADKCEALADQNKEYSNKIAELTHKYEALVRGQTTELIEESEPLVRENKEYIDQLGTDTPRKGSPRASPRAS